MSSVTGTELQYDCKTTMSSVTGTELKTLRRISLSRKRPSRFTENVEWCGTVSSRPKPQNQR